MVKKRVDSANADREKIILRRSNRLCRARFEASRLKDLCSHCSCIKVPRSRNDGQTFYQRTVKEALRSSNEGCKLCQFISQQVGNFDEVAQRQPNALWSMTISQSEEIYGEKMRPTQVEMRLNHNQTPLKYDICRVPGTVTDRGFYSPIEKYEEGHPRKHDGHLRYYPRLVEQDPLSNATLGLVKDWLAACSSHAFCRAQVPQPLPKRLVAVRSDGRLVLTEHHDEMGHYLALSHCWGSVDTTFSTTRENFAQRASTGLQSSQIPRNFRHAIEFTRRLGHEYIWIDSLCILQDDQEDWACEARKMAQYYDRALLTLAVANAMTCHVGFLYDREHYTSPSIGGEDQHYYCFRDVLPDELDLNLKAAINQRAWTLQERLLSHRVVSFTREQLLWYCRECEWAEGYVHNTSRSHDEVTLGWQKAKYQIDRELDDAYWRSRSSDPHYQPYFDPDFVAEIWYKLISEYTTRFLSRPSDKLAAVAGLAEKYAQPEMGHYLAGLWEYDFFRGLAWVRVRSSKQNDREVWSYIAEKAKRAIATRALKPPSQYRAPSWSWASVNGPVELHHDFFYFAKRGASPGMQHEIQHWQREYGPHLVASVLQHSHENPYLDILSESFVQVEGYCRPIWVSKIKLSSEAAGPDGPVLKKVTFDYDQPPELFCYFNQPREYAQVWKELLILQICKHCAGDRLVYGLLLEKMCDGEDAYQRVGIVRLACYNLCSMEEKPSSVGFRYHIHPAQQVFSTFSKADYKTKEWQKERWQKRELRLF